MNRTQSIALVRALAAVSWADGKLERAEESYLLSLAYRLGLGADDLKQTVQPLLDQPVAYDRAMDIVGDLVKVLGSAADRQLFLDELGALFAADGHVADEEKAVLADIDQALARYGAVDFLLGRLRSLFVGSRPASATPARARSAAGNPATRRLLDELERAGVEPGLPDEVIGHIALRVQLMARVAAADDRAIGAAELERIDAALARAEIPEDVRAAAIAVIRSGPDTAMDRQRLCAELNRVTTIDERGDLVGHLFGIAQGAEVEDAQQEIRLIANLLWIPTREFVAIRSRAARGQTP